MRKPRRQHTPRRFACSDNELARTFRSQVPGAHRELELGERLQVSGRLLPEQSSTVCKSDLSAEARKYALRIGESPNPGSKLGFFSLTPDRHRSFGRPGGIIDERTNFVHQKDD